MAKIEDNTDDILNEVDRLIKQKLELAALIVEHTAKQLCPVLTGTLRRSITRQIEKREARVGSNVEYAPFVEIGTSKMTAQPYLRPALHSNMSKIKRIFNA